MKIAIIFFLLHTFLFADSIYFMPYQANDAIKHLVKELRNAKTEVQIAIYSFTNREISKAIRDSAKKGVKYKIIFDYKSNVDNTYSSIGYLAKLNNVEVCTLKGRISSNGKYNGIMHNKLAIIDNKSIIFGSANWSKSAFELNYEMLIISQNKDYINAAKGYFNRMFSECQSY
ncbi:phospholipase D-like domain-containing protein [Helicobacter sp. 16-1353]|uniref:phospholipase D-like domain-containing protein n=1 Tax=Helicobacter sp. 16-1353 TaxID=2004996 RepID=UPI00215D4878|nr:phospholipase D-like domain-containing protein [Helicobacter sp. 16-1353]